MLVVPPPSIPLTAAADDGVTLADVLTNHIDNAERSAAIERQLDALIEWHEETTERLRGR